MANVAPGGHPITVAGYPQKGGETAPGSGLANESLKGSGLKGFAGRRKAPHAEREPGYDAALTASRQKASRQAPGAPAGGPEAAC